MQSLLVLLCDRLFKDRFHLLKPLFYQTCNVLAILHCVLQVAHQVSPKRLNCLLVYVHVVLKDFKSSMYVLMLLLLLLHKAVMHLFHVLLPALMKLNETHEQKLVGDDIEITIENVGETSATILVLEDWTDYQQSVANVAGQVAENSRGSIGARPSCSRLGCTNTATRT